MFWGAVAIFLATSAVLAGAFVPSLRRSLTPRLLVGWGGIAIPLVILTALVAVAFVIGEQLLSGRGAAGAMRIEVVARQFVWEFSYPDRGGTTLNELHIPVGADIEFTVESIDVIHSFWIPRLGGKIDAIPGHTNRVRLRADRPGTYGGTCAEFCGTGHTDMRFTVIAHPSEDYDAALAAATGRGE